MSRALLPILQLFAAGLLLACAQQSPVIETPTQFTTAPQCKCSDIVACSAGMAEKTAKCKADSTCEAFLKKIGDSNKIRACLDTEHSYMTVLEDCVKAKVNGELGCTNDAHPQNMTIPLIPLIEAPVPSEDDATTAPTGDTVAPEAAQAAPPGQGPPELAHYLMCVDQCSLGDIDFTAFSTRRKRSPVNCAFKLRCALAPPTEAVQRAFQECERELKIVPSERYLEGCRCLQAAGVQMQCTLPIVPAQ